MRHYICLLLAVAAFGQETPHETGAGTLLQGQVVNGRTGEPVRKARVFLQLIPSERENTFVAISDANGRFVFAQVEPGAYNLWAQKRGFLDAAYGRNEPGGRSAAMKVAPGGPVSEITLKVFPGGAIGGRVLDRDGEPLAGGHLILWSERVLNGKVKPLQESDTEVGPAGDYAFVGLASGGYRVSYHPGNSGLSNETPVDSAGKPTPTRDLTTYYPAALSAAAAQRIVVIAGEERSEIDIRVQAAALISIRGKVDGLTGGTSRYRIDAAYGDGYMFTSANGVLRPNGEFMIENVPPGAAELELWESSSNGHVRVGRTQLEAAGRDVTDAVLHCFQPGKVRVRVYMEGEVDKPLTSGAVFLNALPIGTNPRSSFEFKIHDGVYTFNGVEPGRYLVSFGDCSKCYLKSVEAGGVASDPENGIDVGEGAAVDVKLIFSKKVGSITGEVEFSDPPKNFHGNVVLVSEQPRFVSRVERLSLDQSLHFVASNLKPGKYLAAAVEDDEFNWDNDEAVKALQSECTEVTVGEAETAAVRLKVIPRDKTDAVKRQLGL